MRLSIGNCHTTVTSATDEEAEWLNDYLSFTDEGKAFRQVRGRAKRVAPPKVLLFDPIDDSFPTGLLPLVARRAKEAGFAVSWVDDRPPGPPQPAEPDLSWLRPYQREAVEAVMKRERGIVALPTGSGKTEVFIALTKTVDARWLFVCHRADLMAQTAERYIERTGKGPDSVGYFGGGRCEQGSGLTVATFQTINARVGTSEGRRLVAETEAMAVDESHRLPAATFYRAGMAFERARFRVGFSGTPLMREDRRSLMGVAVLGPIIYRKKAAELIAAGYLAKPTVKMIPVVQYVAKRTWKGVYSEGVVGSAVRNKAISDVAKACHRPFLVYIKEEAHIRELRPMLEAEGLTVKVVFGTSKSGMREAVRKDLCREDVDGAIASVVWQDGVDVPNLRSIIVAAGGRSAIAALQRAGRGMRATEDKREFDVYDVDDVGTPMLERHTRARRRAYEGEGYEVAEHDGLFTGEAAR